MNNQPDVQGFVGWLDKNLSKYYFFKVEGGMLAIIKQFRMPDGLLKEMQNKSFLVKEKIIRKGDSGWQLGKSWTSTLLMPAAIEVIVDDLVGDQKADVTGPFINQGGEPFFILNPEPNRIAAPGLQLSPELLATLKPRERIVCPTDQNVEAEQLMFLVAVGGEIKVALGIETARSVAYTLMKQHNVSCATLYRQERTITSPDQF
ncbi:hypothetical protein [Siphonobacter sp. BAB-5385]|uniref:hypothetical protein n=1 Tax=Siphonobacter sp. BAB-5385 TaxID=1864822 RepID=UPI00114051BB|nr:hypothetical protein [Siphonobacter sp. BAB-5385]